MYFESLKSEDLKSEYKVNFFDRIAIKLVKAKSNQIVNRKIFKML
jgi:hypothetical protein